MGSEQSQKSEVNILTQEDKVILTITSRLLSYPPESMDELRQAVESYIEEEMSAGLKKNDLQKACSRFFSFPSKMLKELYVSTFDLKSKLGLYLTGHEYGDSPKRGAALIKLQRTIASAGYEIADEELADFIPMLLELMTVAPESAEQIGLYNRLAVAIHRMNHSIEQVNPYADFLHVLSSHVLPKPTEKEIADMENNREKADLEELPYPLMYQ